MQHPDYGQGIGDLATQIMQFMLMKKMMGGGQQTTQLGQAPAPPGGMMPQNPQTPWMRQGATNQGISQMGPQGMTPEQLQQLLPLLAQALGLR